MSRDFLDYVEDILEAISDLEEFVGGMEYQQFFQDKKTRFAVVRGLEIIGEACKKIPVMIQEQYPQIPWNLIAGTRNRMIHEYFRVNWEIIWDTLKKDLPIEKPVFQKIMEEQRHE
jgi:uncharacterized protein with HEPN domain